MTLKILKWNEIKAKMQNSVLLAGAAMAASFPMFMYQYRHLSGLILDYKPAPELLDNLALKQSVIVFFAAFLCALVGFLYAERLRLPVFGKTADIAVWLPRGLLIGTALTPVFYLAIDRELSRIFPSLFPNPWPWALADMLGSAITQEVLARLGLLTIGIYFLDRWKFKGYPWPAVAAIAMFGTLGTYLFLTRFGIAQKVSIYHFLISLFLAFGLQWIFCAIYLRWGFVAAVCIHIGLNVKYLIYAVMLF